MQQFDFAKDIILENKNVLLRPLTINDFDFLAPIIGQSPNLLQFSPTQIKSVSELQQYIQNALAERAAGIRYPFIIFDKNKQAYAGSTSFAAVSNKDKRLEIGWTWIGKDFQQSGLNRNCKFLLLQYTFEKLHFERAELKTDERNQQSRSAIEKIGGQFEGILRSHTVMQDGYRRNTVYYSILKQEWQELKHGIFKNFVD